MPTQGLTLRRFAGLVRTGAAPTERDLAALVAAVAPDAAGAKVRTARSGSLALAFTGPEPARTGDALCLADAMLSDGGDEQGVLAAWQRDGERILPGLRGDFALVLYDAARDEGLLVRDQLGLRGLVHCDRGATLLFAGEVHQLLRLLPATPTPDLESVAMWLEGTAPLRDRTMFDRVRRVEAACALRLRRGHAQAFRYWAPPKTTRDIGAQEAATLVRAGIVRALERQIPNGDNTAVMLSGGLDSATVGGIATQLLAPALRPGRAYSAVFPLHPDVDETTQIEKLASAYGVSSTRAIVRRGSLLYGALPYIERFAVPPVSPNMFFWLPLMRAATADGIEVLLDGEGGDELYGSSPFLVADELLHGRLRSAVTLVERYEGGGRGNRRRRLPYYLREFGLEGLVPAAAHDLRRRLRGPQRIGKPYMAPAVRRALWQGTDGGHWKRLDRRRWRAWMVYASTRVATLVGYDHMRRRTDLAGLAARHPLVDVDLIELMLSLPPELALDPARSRPLLRAAGAGIVPDAVRLRPDKSTFDAVFHDVLATHDLAIARALLDAPDVRAGTYVDLDAVRAQLTHIEPPGTRGARQRWAIDLWRLLTLECWLRFVEDPAELRQTIEQLGLGDPDLDLVTSPSGR